MFNKENTSNKAGTEGLYEVTFDTYAKPKIHLYVIAKSEHEALNKAIESSKKKFEEYSSSGDAVRISFKKLQDFKNIIQ